MTERCDPMPFGYALSVGVIVRLTLTTPTVTHCHPLSANHVPRNKPKRKADRACTAHWRYKGRAGGTDAPTAMAVKENICTSYNTTSGYL